MILEIVVYNFQSAQMAQEGGADRIELCENPADGGTTPSYGMIKEVRRNLTLDVMVMIRPRGGDFHYSQAEFQIMKSDIIQCQKLSVDGVVFGILTPDGRIDRQRCKELIELARPLKVTCHRAFDMARDPFEALEDCIEIGFDRILTAGQQARAMDGIPILAALVERAGTRISIMPGSGVNENTVTEIVAGSGAKEIHFSATAFVASKMEFRNQQIAGMGSAEGSEFSIRTVDPTRVRTMRALAEQAQKK